jgi:hypothetical protein
VTAAVVHLLSGLARQGAPTLTHAKRLSDGGKVHVLFNGSNPALVGRIWVIENTRLKRGVPGMKKAAFITMACAASFAFASAAQAAITASDGRYNGKELTLTVHSPESGWAVIHLDENGQPGADIGHAAIHQGENKNVQVELERKVKPGEHLIVMLHEDKGEKGRFEFGPASQADVPAMENGHMVITPITVK